MGAVKNSSGEHKYPVQKSMNMFNFPRTDDGASARTVRQHREGLNAGFKEALERKKNIWHRLKGLFIQRR